MRDNTGPDKKGPVNTSQLIEGRGPPGSFVLESGALLPGVPVRLGAQSWGELNAARDNAVLVCHYYTGTMQAAGRNSDGTPGWWEALIGPGKVVDTSRFFVICMNSFSNVQARDGLVITTGPDSTAPDGQAWGERFPAWSFAELHAAQLALMHALKLPRWHAVIGPSFGGMQALQWAARTPELAPRVAAIATSPQAGPVLREVFAPTLRDVAQNSGLEGTLRLISYFGMGSDGLEGLFREASFAAYLRIRSGTASLAHILDIGRVVATHDLGAVTSQSELFSRWVESGLRLLTANIQGDQFFPAAEMRAFAQDSRAAGVQHQHVEFSSPSGHLGCVLDTRKFAPALSALLTDSMDAVPETVEATHA